MTGIEIMLISILAWLVWKDRQELPLKCFKSKSTKVGDLVVNIKADTSDFMGALEEVEKKLRVLEESERRASL